MKKRKNILLITILFLTIGFAAVSTTLFLNGTINVGTNESDFDVYFSNAIIDGEQNVTIISSDKKTINFETNPLASIGSKSILEYEITNASTQYDANVSVTCTPSESELYKVTNSLDKEIIEARSSGYGILIVELKKNVIEEKKINFTCTINSNALERETSNETALPTDDIYVLEGTYVDSTGKAIPNANLVVYSDTPHYVTTDESGNLLVSNLERGRHEIYHINDTLENIKNMTKEEIVKKAITRSNFYTNSNEIRFSNNNSITSNIIGYKEYCSNILGKTWEFSYTGKEQEFFTICDGDYKIELWGASGGTHPSYSLGGNGAYTSGDINLPSNTDLYVYVGSVGGVTTSLSTGLINNKYNGGGGAKGQNISNRYWGTGGGSTDVRLVSGNWNDFESLKSRIMVAAAGGGGAFTDSLGTKVGGAGGGLTGYQGAAFNTDYGSAGFGATQTSAGYATCYSGSRCTSDWKWQAGNYGFGSFGWGGTSPQIGSAGGGSGYYGGGSTIHLSTGGGGSSFISGHNGCNAIDKDSTSSKLIHTNQPNHYSGLVFTNTKMVDGAGYNWTNVKGNKTNMPTHDGKSTMTGNKGNGYAKITYLGNIN